MNFQFFTEPLCEMSKISNEDRKNECIAFALNLQVAAARSDLSLYFHMMNNAPKSCKYIVNHFIDKGRKAAVKYIIEKLVKYPQYFFSSYYSQM